MDQHQFGKANKYIFYNLHAVHQIFDYNRPIQLLWMEKKNLLLQSEKVYERGKVCDMEHKSILK